MKEKIVEIDGIRMTLREYRQLQYDSLFPNGHLIPKDCEQKNVDSLWRLLLILAPLIPVIMFLCVE